MQAASEDPRKMCLGGMGFCHSLGMFYIPIISEEVISIVFLIRRIRVPKWRI